MFQDWTLAQLAMLWCIVCCALAGGWWLVWL